MNEIATGRTRNLVKNLYLVSVHKCLFVVMPDLSESTRTEIRHPASIENTGFSMRVFERVVSTGLRTAGMTDRKIEFMDRYYLAN
jgi:hypothetical protein